MNKHVKRISITALFTALVLVATAYVKVPIVYGYIHIGDVFIMLASFFLPSPYAVIAAICGSALADLISGYVAYIPATIIVKGVMALIACLVYRKKYKIYKTVIASALASIVMIAGYFAFESIYYGIAAAVANLPLSLIQPAVTIALSVALTAALGKVPYLTALKAEMAITVQKRTDFTHGGSDKNDVAK